MKFDVIISNPPYQISDGGGTGSSAIPIYDKFVLQAKKLNPRYLTMITPSRWFAGGKGLDDFRNEMLNDNRLRVIHDYPDAGHCFPGVEIKGGVCFFLWDRENPGLCSVYTHENDKITSAMERPLLENGNEVLQAWFTGYFPSYKPRYAVTVLVENGVSGNRNAGPVFKEIADKITEYAKSLRKK